jgi:hypothetical protein
MTPNTMIDQCVYMHFTPNTNELFYIGMGLKRRARNITDRNKYWKQIVVKHGLPNIVIIAEDLTVNQAAEIEKFWIKHHGLHRLSNISPGGNRVLGFLHSDKTRMKMSKSATGKKASLQARHNMRMARLGKKSTEEHRRAISKAMKNSEAFKLHKIKLAELNRDKTIYNFYHDKYGKISCTQYELRITYNLDGGHLTNLIKDNVKTCKGWRIDTHN